MPKNRITEVDFVRGISIICVHIGHCGIELGPITRLWQSFFMSSFFIFSGYFSKTKTVKKEITSTLLLYYIWAIGIHTIVSLLDIRHGSFSIKTWTSWIGSILLGIKQPNECAQLWFLVALFTTRLIWHFLCKISILKKRIVFVAILSITGMILNFWGIKAVPFRLVTALVMLPLFTLGYMISVYQRPKILKGSHSLLNLAFMTVVWCMGVYIHNALVGMSVSIWSEEFNIYPLFYLNAIMGTIVFLYLSKLIDKAGCLLRKVRDMICFYGRNSLTAFLIVNLLIIIVDKILVKTGVNNLLSPQKNNYLNCIIVLLLQIPMAWILNNRKVAKIALLKKWQ